MGTARIMTDAGAAYIKALGNRQGPHPLACELIATRLARWFGLPTFPFAIIEIDAEFDEIPYRRGGYCQSGPAFVTKATPGHPWGGSAEELATLANFGDIGKLVVFDNWVRNCDRHPPDLQVRRPNYDNVFLESLVETSVGKSRLVAMDHTHCFTCGRDLDSKVSRIDNIKDERLYGLFPGFRSLIRQTDVETAVGTLNSLDRETIRPLVEDIPDQWQVDQKAKSALLDLITQRADFVANTILESIAKVCWPDRLFDTRADRS